VEGSDNQRRLPGGKDCAVKGRRGGKSFIMSSLRPGLWLICGCGSELGEQLLKGQDRKEYLGR
jgi:hypothetical protein